MLGNIKYEDYTKIKINNYEFFSLQYRVFSIVVTSILNKLSAYTSYSADVRSGFIKNVQNHLRNNTVFQKRRVKP